MNLFCEKCKANHEFTEDEVERLLYALEAEISDLHEAPLAAPKREGYGWVCLNVVLAQWAGDQEMYWEYTEGRQRARQALDAREIARRVVEAKGQPKPVLNPITFTATEAESLVLLLNRTFTLLDFHTERAICDENADDVADDGQLLVIELSALLADLEKRTGMDQSKS
jgi:hypothetical protein